MIAPYRYLGDAQPLFKLMGVLCDPCLATRPLCCIIHVFFFCSQTWHPDSSRNQSVTWGTDHTLAVSRGAPFSHSSCIRRD